MSCCSYGKSIRGASHIRNHIECQDSCRIENTGDHTIIAVADGHGSKSCPYSKSGSAIAVNVFCDVMKNLIKNFNDDAGLLPTYLNREGEFKIAQHMELEWKRRVMRAHRNRKRSMPMTGDGNIDQEELYHMYGTTLLGLLLCKEFVFAFQIGDGDIMLVDGSEVSSVIEYEKFLGTQTYSLCQKDSWKNASTSVRMISGEESMPQLYFVSTDGFANSFKDKVEMEKACKEYLEMIKQYGFETVVSNIPSWLHETSRLGCGDDITVALGYYE